MNFQLFKQKSILTNIIKLFSVLLIFYTANTICSSAVYPSHKNNHKKKLPGHQVALSATESPEGSPWSNAFNFKGAWGAQIDPGTGILSVHVKAGSLLSNLGHGPNIDLEVNYSSSGTTNADGLGMGWSWNLTHFNPVTNNLVTSIGQNFYLQEKNNGQWYPLYHKMHDIHIDGTKEKHFVITYANGLRETLDHQGYETTLQQQNGWQVHFGYQQGTHRLQSVSDDEGHKITLLYKKGYIEVISKGSEGQPVSVLLNTENSELRKVILPLKQLHNGYGLNFTYIGHLLTKTNYPTGLTQTFTYNCTDAMKISRLEKFSARALCVITSKSVDPGAGQPVMQETYKYSKTNSNEHNYLGFNSQLATTASEKRDILFEAPISYTYQTEEDNGIFREVRTYKYHLLIDDQRISDRTGHRLSEVQTFFCNADKPNGCAHSSFEELPLTYSEPLKIIKSVWSENSNIPATSTETYSYDKLGRMIFHKDAYGRLSEIDYCSLKGDTQCPAEPDGWNLGSLKKSVTSWPSSTGSTQLKPVISRNYYRKLPNRKGNGYILVLDHQTAQSGAQEVTTTSHYYQDADNSLTYGLLKQTILTDKAHKSSKLHEIIHDYYYKMSPDSRSKTTYSAIELGAGKKRFSAFVTISLFTNHVLQKVDASGKNTISYHYDLWGRLVQKDSNIGTPFAAKTYSQYTVFPNHNQLITTAANGLQSKTIFDGAGRALMQFREALSDDGKAIANQWVPVSKTIYDNYGRVTAKSTYMISPSGKTETLTTTQEYDDSGRSLRVHLPDGRTNINLYDDSQRCAISYQQSANGRHSAISVTHANILYKPIEQLLFPGNNETVLSPEQLCQISGKRIHSADIKVSITTYDGFGRVITKTDPLGNIVKKEYDSMGRVINITDPKGDKIHNVYDLSGHVIQHWEQPVSGGNYLLSSAEYNAAGELLWSAGEDGLPTRFTYTKEGKLATTTTPDGHVITSKYNQLWLPVSEQLDGKTQKEINYDPLTLRVTAQTDNTGKTLFTYSDDGLLLYLQHIGTGDYRNYKMQWKYDKNRRVISVTDIDANQTQNIYDKLGRITEVDYQHDYKNPVTLSTFDYDDFSRIISVHYGSGMQRKINYDAFGHANNVSDKLNNKLLSAWSFTYDANNNITQKIYQATNNQKATLNYKYDALNNLITMTCDGSFGLPLCPRNTDFSGTSLRKAPIITQQDYSFTPLNRIAQIHELLQSSLQHQSLQKTVHYDYTDPSVPLRLQRISIGWNHQSESTHNFSYDVMGNMTTDGEGNHITYNAFNQITRVLKPNGEQSDYHYDSNEREVYEKSRLGIHYLFYRDKKLINEQISTPEDISHTIGYHGAVKTIDGLIHQYNESNYKGDVVGVLTQTSGNHQYQLSQCNIYSPYGMRWHANKNLLPAYQQTLFGFDGERTDPATGWQFLGAGHRTYNPQQRYFVSEDPAGSGYGFGSNNPIMNTDPSGNMPRWLGSTLKWANYIGSFGLGALHKKWANIAGAVITSALTVATLGASAYTYGGTLLASVVAAGATLAGSVPVVAATIPANKGLNIAASVVGAIQMVAMVATAAVDIGLYLFASEEDMMIDRSIPLEAFPLNMMRAEDVVERQPVLFNMIKFIKTNLPAMFRDIRGYPHLQINSFSQLSRVWSTLYPQSSLIQCDVGAILAFAETIKKPVDIDMLKDLLRMNLVMRRAIASSISDNEKFVFINDYLSHMHGILESVYDTEDSNFECFNQEEITSLAATSMEAGDVAIVIIPGHVHFVGKFSDDIFIQYIFYGEHVLFCVANLNKTEEIIFNYRLPGQNPYILGLTRFKYNVPARDPDIFLDVD